MLSRRAAPAEQAIERRAAGRARTECAARLQTPGGNWYGRLWDLSEAGARVHVAKPPPQGVMCLIGWLDNELFCRIVWSTEDMCGVLFERPIPTATVLATLGESEAEAKAPAGPAASVTNIPVGRRRGRLWSAGEA